MSANGRGNVQDQIASRKFAVLETAKKSLSLPIVGITQLLKTKNLGFPNGLLVELSAYPECCEHVYEGVVLSHDDRFFRFVVELSKDGCEFLALEEWQEITNETEICNHKRGIGKTFGALALEVRNEILVSATNNG